MFERFAKSVFTCVVDGRTGFLMIYGNDPNQSWPERDHSKVPLYRISKHHFCVLVGVISGLASDWWYVLCTWTWFVHTKDRYTLQISYDFTNHGNFSRDIQLCPFPSWQIGNHLPPTNLTTPLAPYEYVEILPQTETATAVVQATATTTNI